MSTAIVGDHRTPLENQSAQCQTGPSATSHVTRGVVCRQLCLFGSPIRHCIQPVSRPTSHPCLQPSSVTIGHFWRISLPNVKPARQLLAMSHEGWSIASCVSLVCPSAIASSQSPFPPPTLMSAANFVAHRMLLESQSAPRQTGLTHVCPMPCIDQETTRSSVSCRTSLPLLSSPNSQF
jgi:hypothetical protein